MGYVIKFEDIFNVSMAITNQFGARITALNNLSKAIGKLINCTSFTGKSAESIKVYFEQVHGTLICGIIELLQLIQSNYLLYFNEYYYIEGSREALITEETLNNVINESKQLLNDMQNRKSEFADRVREINDIYFPGNPDIQYLLDDIELARESLEIYKDKIEEHEHIYSNVDDIVELKDSLNSLIYDYLVKSNTRSITYQRMDITNSSYAVSAINNIYSVNEYLSDEKLQQRVSKAELQQEKVYKEIVDELARERRNNGIWQAISSGITIAIGICAVVVTGGAAVPVVLGIGSIAFSSSRLYEAGENIIYGANGDIKTEAYNPIRDSVIAEVVGEEYKYVVFDSCESFFAFSSSASIPISSSMNSAIQANASVSRAFTVAFAKEGISVVAGYGADYVGEKLNLGREGKLLLGIFASNITAKGLNKLDANLNVSGFNKAPKAPKVQSEVNTEIPKLQDNVNGEVPKIKGEGVVDTVKGTSSTRPYTKSSLKMGQEMHKAYKADVVDNITKFKEFRLPSGKRIDFIDFETKTIYELKPYNPNGIKTGLKQLEVYLKEVESIYGGGWKTILDTY